MPRRLTNMAITYRTLFAALAPAIALVLAVAFIPAAKPAAAEEKLDELHLDYAYYNPVALLLKQKGFLEDALKSQGTSVKWVLSLGSNKALEFLNAGSIDFGSTAGAAALLAKIHGNPIKSIYAYSKPEWTALVTMPKTGITKVEELKGKRIAVTRGTDPHIFLERALADHGLSDKDVNLVLLQHADGKIALVKGDVDAWAGLDPMMAAAELEDGAKLFYRNPDANTWGILNVRMEFADKHPAVVATVLAAYEKARTYAIAHPDELKAVLASEAKVTPEVAARQLERTVLSHPQINGDEKSSIEAAGIALQKSGIIEPDVNVPGTVADLLESSYTANLKTP
ncbi:MAG TPA: aliphatic sulfonate ABC transporter substrate-binding protein [Magnetospirillaceae bacterium]|jgi:sulfonate transport system substrate-binding protein